MQTTTVHPYMRLDGGATVRVLQLEPPVAYGRMAYVKHPHGTREWVGVSRLEPLECEACDNVLDATDPDFCGDCLEHMATMRETATVIVDGERITGAIFSGPRVSTDGNQWATVETQTGRVASGPIA